MCNNPYEPTRTGQLSGNPKSANRRRWAAIGFIIACLPIAAFGAYGLYADAQYATTLPPNTPRCGNGALAAMLMIFPMSPIIGFVGAGIGFVVLLFGMPSRRTAHPSNLTTSGNKQRTLILINYSLSAIRGDSYWLLEIGNPESLVYPPQTTPAPTQPNFLGAGNLK